MVATVVLFLSPLISLGKSPSSSKGFDNCLFRRDHRSTPSMILCSPFYRMLTAFAPVVGPASHCKGGIGLQYQPAECRRAPCTPSQLMNGTPDDCGAAQGRARAWKVLTQLRFAKAASHSSGRRARSIRATEVGEGALGEITGVVQQRGRFSSLIAAVTNSISAREEQHTAPTVFRRLLQGKGADCPWQLSRFLRMQLNQDGRPVIVAGLVQIGVSIKTALVE